LQDLNSRKRLLFEEVNALKRHLKSKKAASSKKRNAESLPFSLLKFNLTISSDEDTSGEYLSISSKPFSSSKTKLA
jgi:hypothetical protein